MSQKNILSREKKIVMTKRFVTRKIFNWAEKFTNLNIITMIVSLCYLGKITAQLGFTLVNQTSVEELAPSFSGFFVKIHSFQLLGIHRLASAESSLEDSSTSYKMILSRTKNIFMPANVNSIVILLPGKLVKIYHIPDFKNCKNPWSTLTNTCTHFFAQNMFLSVQSFA